MKLGGYAYFCYMVDRLPQEFYDTVKNGDIISVNADEGFVEIV